MKTKIIFEDPDILVIYKPAGLATQTSVIGQVDVVSELKNYLAGSQRQPDKKKKEPYLGIIHRLDQPVEGLLVFARNKQAAAALTTQLAGKDGGFNKKYYALVCGRPAPLEQELTDKLIKNPKGFAEVDESNGKEAILHYRTVVTKRLADMEISLLDVRIETGRFHQIRVQMAHAGMPLLGDSKYGNGETTEISRILKVRNVALCAYEITFQHPKTKKELKFGISPTQEIYCNFIESFADSVNPRYTSKSS